MKLVSLAAVLIPLSWASVAAAASGPDLATTITPPAPTLVKATSRYTFKVTNVGNQNSGTASVAIALPPTHTSPQVYVLGQVVGYSAGCTLTGTTLNCNLGTIRRNNSVSVYIDIKMQVSAAPLVFTATSSTAGDTNPANNSASHTATVLYHAVTAPFGAAVNRHCTGTGLTAFYECTLFSGAITQHATIFNSDGSLSFPGQTGYTGTWTQSGADQLSFVYVDNGTPVATFSGRGASANCFEGLTTFAPPYVAPYEVCF